MPASLLLISGFILLADDRPDMIRVERHLNLMGTTLVIVVEARNRPQALAASEKALTALQRAELRLSTWTKNSELARLNEAEVGQAVDLSPELVMDLAGVRRCWEATGGAFDPGVGALAAIWGLRSGGTRPSDELIRSTVSIPGFEALRLEGATAARLHPDLSIDEGGFGKGAGLDDAIRVLSETDATGAVINLGGQVALYGSRVLHRLDIAHPSDRHQSVLTVSIEHGALATSGNGERNLLIDGMEFGHILDPRSGMPVTDFGSVTVWAKDALTADCLSTGLYVLGPDRALDWAAENDGVEVLVLEFTAKGLRARATTGMKDRIEMGGPGVDLSFH